MRYRMLTTALIAVATVIAMTTPASAGITQSRYTADSFFRSTTAGLPVDTARTTSFRAFMASHPDQGGKGITWPKLQVSKDWAMSYDYGDTGDRVWKLKTPAGAAYTGRLAVLSTQGFHMSESTIATIPTGATLDRPLVVIDRVWGYTLQFFKARFDTTTGVAYGEAPGIMWHGSNALDYRNPRTTDTRNQTSRGRILESMVVTREELDAAVKANTGVGKVLHIFFVETKTTDGFVHPMTGAESSKNGWGAEGTRIGIDPKVDLVARGLTGHALAIARTLQENGGYLGDNSGSSTFVKLSQASHYTGTNITADVFKGKLSWNDFLVYTPGSQ